MENNKNENRVSNEENLKNHQQQAVDKTPGEERGKGEQVSNADLKGKKIDADPQRMEDQPIRQLP